MIALFGAIAMASALQTALDQRVAGASGTGIAVGIIDRGKQSLYFAGTDGKGRPVDGMTLFEIGSVTKTFTATALAKMVLAKQIQLDAPISKSLPPGVRAPSRDGKQITLLDLAEQRSGLPRLPTNMNGSMDDPYANYGNEQMYAFLNGYTLTRDPGSQYEYSNYGVGLLGQLIARSAKVTYAQLLARDVLVPLGMNDTVLMMTSAASPARLAAGHDLAGNVVPAWRMDAIAPAGGIASNLDDMLKYLRCNMGSGPLATACRFAQRPRAPGEEGHQIGLIWNIDSATGTIGHSGSTEGFNAVLLISQDRQTGVVVLGNGPAVDDIAAHIITPSFPIASCPANVPVTELDPTSYTGTYCNQSGGMTFVVKPAAKPDELSIALLPQPSVNVPRVAPDVFYASTFDAKFTFMRNGSNIVGLWLAQYGQTIPAVRLDAQGKPLVGQLASPFPQVVPLDSAKLQQYVGSYSATGTGTFSVTLRGDGLYVQLSGQPAAPVFASALDQFFYKIVDAQIDFNRNAAGNITSLTLHQNGKTVTAVRLDAQGKGAVSDFPPVVTLDPAKLQQYIGTYNAKDIGTFTVTLRSDGLYVQLSGQPAAPVFASALDQFFYKIVDAQIDFNRNAAGNVTSLTLHQNGQTITAVRANP